MIPANFKKFMSKGVSSPTASSPKKTFLKSKLSKVRKESAYMKETPAEEKSKNEEADGKGGPGVCSSCGKASCKMDGKGGCKK